MAHPTETGASGLGSEAAAAEMGAARTEMAAGSSERKVSAAEIGRDWGTSRAYASKCIKKGCPTDSLEAARKWREEHAKYGVGYRSKGGARNSEAASLRKDAEGSVESAGASLRKDEETWAGRGEEAAAARPLSAAGVEMEKAPAPVRELGAYDFSTLEGSLAAAIAIEQEAFAMVTQTMGDPKRGSAVSVLIQNYNKARDGRMEAEKRVQELREAEEKVVPMDKAKEMIRRVLVPLLTRLRAVSKRAGFKANPTDDVHAESVIREEIETAIGEARLEFVG